MQEMRTENRFKRIGKAASRDFKNNWAFAVMLFVALGLGAVLLVQAVSTTPKSWPVILIWSVIIAFSLLIALVKFIGLLVETSRKSLALQKALAADEESYRLQKKLADLDVQFRKMEIDYHQTEVELLARQNKVRRDFVYKKTQIRKPSLKEV